MRDKLPCHRATREAGTARYYLCPHHDPARAGVEECRCSKRRIRADEFDAFVFDEVANLLACPPLLTASEAALAERALIPDDDLLAAQLARMDRRLEEAEAERRRLADLYQAGVIDQAELIHRRAGELEARRNRLGREPQALSDQHAELSQHNRLAQRTEDFAERLRLLRLVLEDVRVQGWNAELRLRIPLDEDPAHGPPMAPLPISPSAKKPTLGPPGQQGGSV